MQPHKEILGDRKANRQDREVVALPRLSSRLVYVCLLVAAILAGSAAPGLASETSSAAEPVKTPDVTDAQTFPFMAEITGDNVYYRSGPGTNFYECGKLNQGDKVKVVSKQFSWYRIVPPPKSFAWISTQYVKIDPADPDFGIVTGDRVRVYAGSDRVKPHYSTSLLGKLNKGEKVRLLGEQLDEYYKIAPPASAYLWVSTYFTKPLPPEKTPPVTKAESPEKVTPPAPAVKPGDVPKVVKIDVTAEPGALEAAAVRDAAKTVPQEVQPKSRLEQYQALQKRIQEERVKPWDQQDYKDIKKELTEIADDKEAGKVAEYAKKVLERVAGIEFAISVIDQVRTQNEQLQKIQAGIDKARQSKLAEVQDLSRFAVTGKLQPFALYGEGNYRIVDDSGKMLCYALPSDQVSQMNLSSLIGKKVGLVGTIQPHLPTKQAMVRFSEIVPLN